MRDVVEHPVTMNLLAARKAFAAYEPHSFDEKVFIRPDVRLANMLAASGGDVDGLRVGGRYPNPMRYSFRDRQIRYLTDDLELLVMIALLAQHDMGPIIRRAVPELPRRGPRDWPAMKPIPWL